ncbi:MAG: hypothetical protein IJN22_06770 [Clostridia bacterium]|nr:hypothetical protein [Clostridia bacterium]
MRREKILFGRRDRFDSRQPTAVKKEQISDFTDSPEQSAYLDKLSKSFTFTLRRVSVMQKP